MEETTLDNSLSEKKKESFLTPLRFLTVSKTMYVLLILGLIAWVVVFSLEKITFVVFLIVYVLLLILITFGWLWSSRRPQPTGTTEEK